MRAILCKTCALAGTLVLFVSIGDLACVHSRGDNGTSSTPVAASKQLILVVTKSWDSIDGELEAFERKDAGSVWQPVGSRTAIVVGRTGLAWGTGLHGGALDQGPIKREGDGKAPAGVFRLSAAFGYAPPDSARNLKLPYIPLTSSIQCIDDINSVHYNTVIDSLKVNKVDWNSYEQMRRQDVLYRWGVLIDHNADPRAPGGGSCIFLHIWRGPTRPTVGCTALDETKLLDLIRWLDPAAHPKLVQLPRAEYERLSRIWKLPSML